MDANIEDDCAREWQNERTTRQSIASIDRAVDAVDARD